jgi:hypothetical protein
MPSNNEIIDKISDTLSMVENILLPSLYNGLWMLPFAKRGKCHFCSLLWNLAFFNVCSCHYSVFPLNFLGYIFLLLSFLQTDVAMQTSVKGQTKPGMMGTFFNWRRNPRNQSLPIMGPATICSMAYLRHLAEQISDLRKKNSNLGLQDFSMLRCKLY